MLPCRGSESRALFSLVPKNNRAKKVLAHELNWHLVSLFKNKSCLDIGHFQSRSGTASVLATLGRGDADIFVGGTAISRIQCSFEMLDNGIVLFHDESKAWSSQVSGENATPFEYGRLRRVVVLPNANTTIGFGGAGRNLVEFDLVWHCAEETDNAILDIVKKKYSSRRKENPRFSRTIEDANTAAPTGRCTRIHTVGTQCLTIRWKALVEIGSGEFGVIWKGVDMDSGRLMAVKKIRKPAQVSHEQWKSTLNSVVKREVKLLSEMSHPRIVDYIASQGWETGDVEIFMGLKDGSLESLVMGGCLSATLDQIATTMLKHMLQALDFLSVHGIVHRDVKPVNILYQFQTESEPGGVPYAFQLGDFGLSNRQMLAKTYAGTPLYMAPEMLKEVFKEGEQTHKADIWSLYVTLLWTMDVDGFRSIEFRRLTDIRRKVQATASADNSRMSAVQEMARTEPLERASAAQMLVKCFDGEGLSTPRNQVLPIPPLTIPTQADGKVPAASNALPQAGPTPPKRPGLRRLGPSRLATKHFRLDKAAGLPPIQFTKRPPRPIIGGRRVQAVKSRNAQVVEAKETTLYPVPGAFPSAIFDTTAEVSPTPKFT